MEHEHAVHLCRGVETGDRVSRAGRGGVTVGRDNDHDRLVVRPAQPPELAEPPVAAAWSSCAKGVSSRASDACPSGSPKRALNSMTLSPRVVRARPT